MLAHDARTSVVLACLNHNSSESALDRMAAFSQRSHVIHDGTGHARRRWMNACYSRALGGLCYGSYLMRGSAPPPFGSHPHKPLRALASAAFVRRPSSYRLRSLPAPWQNPSEGGLACKLLSIFHVVSGSIPVWKPLQVKLSEPWHKTLTQTLHNGLTTLQLVFVDNEYAAIHAETLSKPFYRKIPIDVDVLFLVWCSAIIN